MKSRLLLIQPSFYRSKTDRTLVRMRKRDLVPLVLPYLAALTPSDWEVQLVDEMVTPVDVDANVDLVAITIWTMNSCRAYDLARSFRERGIPVILGGPHVYFYPEEAAQNADAIGVGEAELIWRQMLADAAAGHLRMVYRSETVSDLKGLPHPRYGLLNLRPYGVVKTFAVQSTRGCPFVCDFCSERLYLGGGFRCHPVSEVVAEIRHLPSRSIPFAAAISAAGRPTLGN